MDIVGSLKRAIEIVKLNGSVAAEVGADGQSLQPGLVLAAIGGALTGVLGGPGGLIAGAIAGLVGLARAPLPVVPLRAHSASSSPS